MVLHVVATDGCSLLILVTTGSMRRYLQPSQVAQLHIHTCGQVCCFYQYSLKSMEQKPRNQTLHEERLTRL